MKKLTAATIPLLMTAAVILLVLAAPDAAAESGTDTIDTIMTAGTTQAFSDEPVPAEDIQTILLAGLASESAINQQPWFFVAVSDKEVMEKLTGFGGGMPGGGDMPAPPKGSEMPSAPDGGDVPAPPQGGMPEPGASSGAKAALGDSPLAIIVYMDESAISPNPAFDCGLAVQNMYIAAASLGYGTKIISSPTMTLNGENHHQICELLGVDSSLTAVAVLLVGKPDETVDGVTGATARAGLEDKTAIIG